MGLLYILRQYDSDWRLENRSPKCGGSSEYPVRQDAWPYDQSYNSAFLERLLRRAINSGKRPTDCSACIMQDTGAQGYKMEGVSGGINEDLVWRREVEGVM
jgi:hypothetical protein